MIKGCNFVKIQVKLNLNGCCKAIFKTIENEKVTHSHKADNGCTKRHKTWAPEMKAGA
jgi:hypothetical protein